MQYTHDGAALTYERDIDDTHRVRLRGEQIRQERTGVHARISVVMNNVVLAWGTFNVEKDEDRTRMANSAYKHLNGLSKEYPAAWLKHDLDLFCAGLWDETVAACVPEDMAGEEDPQPPEFLLHPYVLSGGGTILFAPPGRGKSYMSMLMAVSIDAGVNTSLWKVRQAPVLFVNLERHRQGVKNRLGTINRALGLPPARSLLTFNARGKSLTDVLPACERMVREREIGCVFLDSISRAGAGDLNENQPVNRIIDMLNGLCDSWVGLGHTPRTDETHVFGGIHFDAGADVCVQLLSQQHEDGRLGLGMQITKQNDIGKQPMSIIALDFNESGLTGVRRAKKGEFPEVESGKKPTLRQEVADYLLEVGKDSASGVAQATKRSRANIAELLSGDDWFVRVGRQGHEVLYAVKGTS